MPQLAGKCKERLRCSPLPKHSENPPERLEILIQESAFYI